MSLASSGRLKSAALDLDASMRQAADVWRDVKAEEFWSLHIEPILRAAETACLAMDEIASIVNQMKRECGPPREDIY
jgi:hypothetical protein